MFKRFSRITVFLLLTSVAACAQTADKVLLRFHLKPGQQFHNTSVIESKTAQTVAGKQMSFLQTMNFGVDTKVTAVDDAGITTVAMTISSLQIKMNGAGQSFAYDSTRQDTIAAGDPLSKVMGALVGSTLTITYDATGKVTQLAGWDAIVARMIDSIDMPPGASKASLEAMLKKSINEKQLQQMAGGVGGYPEQPIGVGDSWTHSANAMVGMASAVQATLTLQSRQNGRATIAMKFKVKPDPNAPAMQMGTTKIRNAMDISAAGTYEIDQATGWTTSGDFRTYGAGKVNVYDPTRKPKLMTSKIFTKATVHMESKETTPPAPATEPGK